MSDLAAIRVDLRDCIPRDNDEAQLLEYAQTLLAEADRLTAENARLRGALERIIGSGPSCGDGQHPPPCRHCEEKWGLAGEALATLERRADG